MQNYSLQQLDAARCALIEILRQDTCLNFAVIENCPSFTGLVVRVTASQKSLVPEQCNGVPIVTYSQEKIIDLTRH